MQRLFLSIVFAVLGSLFFIGWALDQLVAQQTHDQESEHIIMFKQLLNGFDQQLSIVPNAQLEQYTENLATQFDVSLSIEKTANIALPLALKDELTSSGSLLLASDQQAYILRTIQSHPEYLLRFTLPPEKPEDHKLNLLLTTILYVGVCTILMFWLFPLARRLYLLTDAAERIGTGKLDVRVPISRFSYIKRLEVSFNNMAAQIEKLVADNKVLARSLSHDIRTPMSCLRFGVEAAIDTPDIDKKNDYLLRMETELTRMEEMTSAFLEYAGMERKGFNLTPEPTSLNELIASLRSDFSPIAAQHQITIELSLPSEEIILPIDAHWFYRALQNLLSNAMQYAKNEVLLSLQIKGNKLVITVEDDGIGIEEKQAQEIFSPFVKLDDNRSREKGHFGLGLAICAKVVDWHHGQIAVTRSTALAGAKFSIELPLKT
ncbi:ATP-binding protein [Thalassotalea fusca]